MFQHPQTTLEQMVQSNPHTGEIMSMIQQNGGDGESLFYQVAKQRGVTDPVQFLNQVKALMPK